ncbi:MAG: HU family DNA-binding protein [Candidatus Hydrogenedentota bacterium]
MTKRELVVDVAERLGYTQNEVADVIQATLDTITETLAEGSRLEIRNFGVFEIKTRDARIGRNPRTGEAVPIYEKRVAIFKPGKALKQRVEHGVNQELRAAGGQARPKSPSGPDKPAM